MTPTQAQIEAADKLAVKIVTLVSDRISKDGKLYAYDGIEAAREARNLIVSALAAVTEADDTEWKCADCDHVQRGHRFKCEKCKHDFGTVAEVGEPRLTGPYLDTLVETTIERCAQYIEKEGKWHTVTELVAGIRALKEEK